MLKLWFKSNLYGRMALADFANLADLSFWSYFIDLRNLRNL